MGFGGRKAVVFNLEILAIGSAKMSVLSDLHALTALLEYLGSFQKIPAG